MTAREDETIRRGAEATRQDGRTATEAAYPGAGVAADPARQGTRAGVEVPHRTAEDATDAVCQGAQAVVEDRRRIARDAPRTPEQVNPRRTAETARGTSEDTGRAIVPPDVAEGGLRDMQQAVAGLVEGVVQTNLRASRALFRLADPAAYVELQQRFVHDHLDALMQGTAILVRAVRRTADGTLRPLEERVQRRRQTGE